ncbi:MAG: acyl carrier protein [Candidatus Kuenenia sp.]|nr:acyl carrier protein [Candidatus Kuenenia hertensis]
MAEVNIKEIINKHLMKVAPEADLEELSPDANIREELDIDSYDFLQFLIAINEEIGIEIPEADYGKLSTIESIVEYLSARINV